MTKREFLHTAMAALGSIAFPRISDAQGLKPRTVADAGVTFRWHHDTGRLHTTLAAPTPGWIAVGFNETRSLSNTRFVIAAVSAAPIRVEEHIALVPDHREVGRLGLPRAITDVSGYYDSGVSHLAFSLPQDFPDRPSLRLSPGSRTYLMLAWSDEPDFDHHSAWRRHYDLIL